MAKKSSFYVLLASILTVWVTVTLYVFVSYFHVLDQRVGESISNNDAKLSLRSSIEKLEEKIRHQERIVIEYSERSQRILEQQRQRQQRLPSNTSSSSSSLIESNEITAPVTPVLMFACNRVTVTRALDLLLSYRPSKKQFPIIVSQDCGHEETAKVIETYGEEIVFIKQPDLSDIQVPSKEKKFKGYFKIARHYGWALNETFYKMGYNQVIIVEDDLEVSPDFYEYFSATLPILRKDPTLWCVSAWNDNGKENLIDQTKPEVLYRSDFFGGLGWMITRELWTQELAVKWPKSYWDDWMRNPAQRKGRACIRPEISRTKTFGKIGVSHGLFYDKHLKFILLNSQFVRFKSLNLTGLIKQNYDHHFIALIQSYPVVNILDLKNDSVVERKHPVRVMYHTKENFKRIASVLKIMDDFKSGVPRMAYNGIVPVMYKGRRVYVSPSLNWKGYDISW